MLSVEFRSISEMLKLQRGIQQSGGHVKAKRWLSAGFVAKFVTGAKAIVRDTRLTSTKLEKLHLLCDPCNNRGDDEIEELTAIVKQDVVGCKALFRTASVALCFHYLIVSGITLSIKGWS